MAGGGFAGQAARSLPKKFPIAGVKQVILVASGKGGVGKSTLAVNLALAISEHNGGRGVGLLDGDVYGPSIPKMLNLRGPIQADERKIMEPLLSNNVKCMSMGFLVDERSPTVWRGLMVNSAVVQFLRQVAWGPLDYLVVDMPPGTGDTQLTITQNIPIDGVVIVTTPQDVALADARKGTEMFRKVNARVVGIVENMASFACPKCGEQTRIFGSDEKLQNMAKELNLDVLGSIPLHPEVVEGSDSGNPIAVSNPSNPVAILFREIARKVLELLPPWKNDVSSSRKSG